MQEWDPNAYAANARFVSDLGTGVVELLDPQEPSTSPEPHLFAGNGRQ